MGESNPPVIQESPVQKKEQHDWKKIQINLEKALSSLESNGYMLIGTKEENLYYRTMGELTPVYASAPEKIRSLNTKVLNGILQTGFNNYSYIDPRTADVIEKTIELGSGKDFGELLDILSKIENNYALFQDNPVQPVRSLVATLEKKASSPLSNLLLSQYVQKIISDPKPQGTSIEGNRDLIEIGNNQFADVSMGIWSDTFSVSEPEDYEAISALLQKKSTARNALGQDARRVLAGYAYSEEEKQLKVILNNVKNIPTKPIDASLLSASKTHIPTADYARLFGLIWSNDEFRKNVERSIGIQFKEYSLPEQAQIIDFLTTLTNSESSNIQQFSETYGKTGFRTFLSMEQGGKEMGDTIVMLGEKLPHESARLLFAKYGELVDAATVISEEEIKKYYKNPNPELAERLKTKLLSRGKSLLEGYADSVAKGTLDESKIPYELDSLKADNELFRNLFRLAKEDDKNASFEDFLEMSVGHTSGGMLSEQPEKIEKMKQIIRKNYPDNPDLQATVLASFENKVQKNNEATSIHLLERNNEVVAFDRIDYLPDGSVYFGSFNVDSQYCSAGIGNSFFKATVQPFIGEQVIRADCSSLQPISSYYIEAGFVGTKSYVYASEPSLSVESVPGKSFATKSLTHDEILALKDQPQGTNSHIEIRHAKKQSDISFDDVSESKVLTRYFFDRSLGEWFAVLERRS